MKSEPITSYAQNREDVLLQAYFHDVHNGTYIDIGANHPVVDSVTNLFYENGWTGINVEPLPDMYNELVRLRPNDININSLVGESKGTSTLHVYHTAGGFNGLSTASKKQEKVNDKEKRKDILKKEDIEVKVITLKEVFSLLPKNKRVHFLKIDVEGLELEVLSSNDWNMYRPEIICIEADHVFNNWQQYIKEKGYALDFNDGINDYYVEEKSKRKLATVYVDQVLKKTYVSLYTRIYFQEQLEKVKARSYYLESLQLKKIAALKQRNSILEHHITSLSHELQRKSRLPLLIIDSVKAVNSRIEHRIAALKVPKYTPVEFSVPTNKNLSNLLQVAKNADAMYADAPKIGHFKKITYYALYIPHKASQKCAKIAFKIALKVRAAVVKSRSA